MTFAPLSFLVRKIPFSLVMPLSALRVNGSALKGKDLAWAGMGGELRSQNISLHFFPSNSGKRENIKLSIILSIKQG